MSELLWNRVHWPQPLPSSHALELLRRLAAEHGRDPVAFEATGTGGRVTHRIGTTTNSTDAGRLVEALIPGTVIEPAPTAPTVPGLALRLQLHGGALGLQADRATELTRVILTALASTHEEETLTVQIVIEDGVAPSLVSVHPHDPAQGLLSQLFLGQRSASAETTRRLRAKVAEPNLAVYIRLSVDAKTPERSRTLLRGLVASLRTAESAGSRLEFLPARADRMGEIPRRGRVLLSVSELAGLLAWPLDTDTPPGLPSPHPRQLRLPASLAEHKRAFGATSAPGRVLPLGVAIEDACQHMVVTGPIGSGKSSLLLNLILNDMKVGRSVILIDPKTDLAMDVLARVPESRLNDVVVIDPTQELPVGINPFASHRSPELVADGILAVIRDLYPNLFGPRTSDVLHSALLTLASVPGATLAWLPRLLTEPGFRSRIIPTITDEHLRSFWTQFDALGAGAQAQYVGPVLSRLRQFLLRPGLRRILDQPEPRFDLNDIFTRPRIVVVPLNSGLIGGEAARLLGSLLISTLWGLTLARAAVPQDKRRPLSIYIDEAQEFLRLGGELPNALERSRSLKVAWHLAHQFRGQFTTEVQEAIDANARNKVAFALQINDARDYAAMTPQLVPEDYLALDRFHFYAQLVRDGRPLPWVSGKTLPPPPATGEPVEVIRRSQVNYGARLEANPTTPPQAGNPANGESLGRRARRHE